MNNKKMFLIIPPLVTALPLIIHNPTRAKADTAIKIVAMNNEGNNSSSSFPTLQSPSDQSNIGSEPTTGITASQPITITSNSQVSSYVPASVINKNKEQLQKQKEAKEAYLLLVAKKEAVAKAKAEAEARQKALEQEKAKEQQKALEQKKIEEQEKAKEQQKQEKITAEQETQTTQPSQQSQSQTTNTPPENTTPTSQTSSYTGGLNMNQTSGTVDISALASYMSSTVGGDVNKWIYTITHESGGDLQNWYNKAGGNPYTQGYTAYGVFQLLGHGEYLGMTLQEQITLAQQVFSSQGWGAWVASYGY